MERPQGCLVQLSMDLRNHSRREEPVWKAAGGRGRAASWVLTQDELHRAKHPVGETPRGAGSGPADTPGCTGRGPPTSPADAEEELFLLPLSAGGSSWRALRPILGTCGREGRSTRLPTGQLGPKGPLPAPAPLTPGRRGAAARCRSASIRRRRRRGFRPGPPRPAPPASHRPPTGTAAPQPAV